MTSIIPTAGLALLFASDIVAEGPPGTTAPA